jgi:hypothetical protein
MADDEKMNHVTKTIDSSLAPDRELEADVQRRSALPLHPLVTQIHEKFGVFNFIRNARNARQKAIDDVEDAG